MSSSDRLPIWWDCETDDQTGARLRADVREAAHRVWKGVRLRTRELLGDANDAAEVLEASVKTISRYLDKNNIALHSADPAGLLLVACHRSLHRLVKKRRRIELIGPTSDWAEILRAPDWRDQTDRRLFLEELAHVLDPATRGILRLRIAGYDWKDIGRMLHMTAGAARASFWRDVRRGYSRLLRAAKDTRPEEL